jgi:hypothetical protein
VLQMLLIAVLCAATLGLAGLAAAQLYRRRVLARIAAECGMRFSVRDPFDVARRYGRCELMQSGHASYAENVIYGRVDQWFLRAFDYHVEAAHGPHRFTRGLSVVAADAESQCAPALVWRGEDARVVPILSSEPLPLPDGWQGCGEPVQAQRLIASWPAEGSENVGIQACGNRLMFWADRCLKPAALARQLRAVAKCLDLLTRGGQ